MFWWAVAIVGGWLASGALISSPVEAQQAGQRRRANERGGDGEGVLRPGGGNGFNRCTGLIPSPGMKEAD